jgi:hypothetical protein
MRATVYSLVALMLPIQIVQAEPMPTAKMGAGLVGDWHGSLPLPGRFIPLVLHVSGVPGRITATLDDPSQGVVGLPISLVAQEGAGVRFQTTAPGPSYVATLSADGQTLTGRWTQTDVSIPLTMTKMRAIAAAVP